MRYPDTPRGSGRLAQALGAMRNAFSLVGMLLVCTSAFGQEMASVCVAPVPNSTSGNKSLSNTTASAKPYEFTVTIDGVAPVSASHSTSTLIANLLAATSHRVSIHQGGDLATSFRFRFAEQKSNHLCLWFKPLYESWSLWPMSDSKGKCSCHSLAANGT